MRSALDSSNRGDEDIRVAGHKVAMTKSVIIYGQADCDGGFATLSVEVALAKALLITHRRAAI